MVSLRILLVLFPVLAVAHMLDRLPRGRPTIPHVSGPSKSPTNNVHTGESLPPLDTIYYFDQLIDHTNPSLGTFKQRYWHTWEWYKTGELSNFRC